MPVLEAVLDVNARRPDEVLAILERHLRSLEGRTDHDSRARVQAGHRRRPRVAGDPDRRAAARGRCRRARPRSGCRAAAGGQALAERESSRATTLEDAVEGADAVVLVTRWREYEQLPDVIRASGSDAISSSTAAGCSTRAPSALRGYRALGGRSSRRRFAGVRIVSSRGSSSTNAASSRASGARTSWPPHGLETGISRRRTSASTPGAARCADCTSSGRRTPRRSSFAAPPARCDVARRPPAGLADASAAGSASS